MCQIVLSSASVDEFSLERMVFLKIKPSTNFTFTAENPYNSLLYSMPCDELNLVQQL